MAKSPLPVAIFVVFVTGGAVGGGTAALIMRAQQEPPQHAQQQSAPHELHTQRPSTLSPSRPLVTDGEGPQMDSPSLATPARGTTPATNTTLTDDDDPGTGAWLTDSLTQLEQKYQAMMQRASETQVAARQETATVAGEILSAHPAETQSPTSPEDAPDQQQPVPDATAAEPAQNYIAQANITQNNTSTTNVTQVNQTVLMGYVPLLVPVPAAPGQASATPAQVAPLTTTTPWVGLSPWAPIDMSRHNNPWKSSRLP